MPEYPDIYILVRSMNEVLPGLVITDAQVNQPKCLNLPPDEFRHALLGRAFRRVAQRARSPALAFIYIGTSRRLRLMSSATRARPHVIPSQHPEPRKGPAKNRDYLPFPAPGPSLFGSGC